MPTQDEFIALWNAKPVVSSLAAQLGITSYNLKSILADLKKKGVALAEPSGRGRAKLIDINDGSLYRLWQESSTLDEVIKKLDEMGYAFPEDRIRRYLTSWASKVNKLLRARNKPELKKLERPTHRRKLKLSDVNLDAPFETLTEPEEEHDTLDVPTYIDDIAFEEPNQGSEEKVEDWKDEPIFSSEDEQEEISPDDEFTNIWNNAETESDAFKKLKRAGWELSKNEMKSRAKWLKHKGLKLKEFV
jgi:hypothetical protein